MTPEGEFVISASYDRTLKVWDLQRSGHSPVTLEGHGDWVLACAVTRDGQRAVSALGNVWFLRVCEAPQGLL